MEKIYYVRCRIKKVVIEERVGGKFEGVTAAKANQYMVGRKTGNIKSPAEKRAAEEAKKRADEGRYTIDRLWEYYKQYRPSETKSGVIKGLRTDENRYQLHIAPLFGQKTPDEIIPLDIDRLRLKLTKDGKKPQTVKHTIALLRRIIRYGFKKQLCPPLSFDIEVPEVKNKKQDDLSPEQIQDLLEAIEQDSHPTAGPLMKFALFTGMRRGEMFRLEWEHIDS